MLIRATSSSRNKVEDLSKLAATLSGRKVFNGWEMDVDESMADVIIETLENNGFEVDYDDEINEHIENNNFKIKPHKASKENKVLNVSMKIPKIRLRSRESS